MRKVTYIPLDESVPSRNAVLGAMGMPAGRKPGGRILELADRAVSIYRRLAQPIGIVAAVSAPEFEDVYRGCGDNASETPLGNIFGSADDLALFAVTIGQGICDETARLFEAADFALASALDAAASEGVETAADALESAHRECLRRTGKLDSSRATLRFSPGYCGWHIGAQRKLFAHLNPGEIGLSLRDSMLMEPLKSISGVIVCAGKDIFDFDDSFPFCSECETRSCRQRLRQVNGNSVKQTE